MPPVAAICASTDRSIRDLQPAIDDRECLAQLGLGDAQRRVREERVPPDERVQSLLPEELRQRRHLLRRAVERRERRLLRPVAYQLDQAEEADRSRGTD